MAGGHAMIPVLALLAYLATFAILLAYGPTPRDRALGILFWPLIVLVEIAALWAISTGIRPGRRRNR